MLHIRNSTQSYTCDYNGYSHQESGAAGDERMPTLLEIVFHARSIGEQLEFAADLCFQPGGMNCEDQHLNNTSKSETQPYQPCVDQTSDNNTLPYSLKQIPKSAALLSYIYKQAEVYKHTTLLCHFSLSSLY